MATVAVSALHPNLVILDESFQRFKTLLGLLDDFAQSVAGHLFGYHQDDTGRDTRVLLLSATPYTMHTTGADALAGQERLPTTTTSWPPTGFSGPRRAWRGEATSRRTRRTARRPARRAPHAGIEPAQVAANVVASRLLEVMCRTERLAATDNRDGMLTARGGPSADSRPRQLPAVRRRGHPRAPARRARCHRVLEVGTVPHQLSRRPRFRNHA